MILREHVPLSSLTTLKVGGLVRFVVECASESDVREALAFAHAQNLPWSVLGEGSNVLASDEGYAGVLLLMRMPGCVFEETDDSVLVTVGAGVPWDEFVTLCVERGLWGVENLAGIPGTTGASPVQNIGAYGTEACDSIAEVRVLNTKTGGVEHIANKDCAFGYRESRFKHDKTLIILSVVFRLETEGTPSLGYKDLAAYEAMNEALTTPKAIARAVRSIRAQKFPDLATHGTAGSFFKNPTISKEKYAELAEKFEGLPGFPNDAGVKIPLAFVLDHVFNLRGYTEGNVSLFERQPLVLVTRTGATAHEVDVFAKSITERVQDVTTISIEREVQPFPSKI